MEHIIPTFEFGGHTIDVVVKEIDQMVEYNLENVSRTPGTMKVVVLRNGLKSLRVDGKNRPLYHRDSDGDQVFELPNIRDRESRQGLNEKLLTLVVEKNDFLGYDDRFEAVFNQYLPKDDLSEEEEDGPAGEAAADPTE